MFKAELGAAEVDPHFNNNKNAKCGGALRLWEEVICVGKLYFENCDRYTACTSYQSEHNQHQIVRRLRPLYIFMPHQQNNPTI